MIDLVEDEADRDKLVGDFDEKMRKLDKVLKQQSKQQNEELDDKLEQRRAQRRKAKEALKERVQDKIDKINELDQEKEDLDD